MSRDTLSLAAPAKINLSLRVRGRREDGYHEVETLMVPIDLADRLTLSRLDEPAGTIDFSCTDPDVPNDQENLVMKALALVAERNGPLPAMRVHLEKSIPHGAGLGGGSSDAAAALRGANELFGLRLTMQELHDLAARLGSDVPFFLHGCPCLCRGRGELVDPMPARQPRLPVLLLKPPFPVPTPWAYQQWASAPALPGILYGSQTLTGADGALMTLVNDLERPVFAKHLLLADMKMWLLNRSEVAAVLMSGSGSTLFAVLRSSEPVATLIAAATDEFGSCLWLHQGRTV